MKLYHFRQNNSGGRFEYSRKRGISVNVFVEAESAEVANRKAVDSLGIYFDGCRDGLDCDCCGDRWYETSEYASVEGREQADKRAAPYGGQWEPVEGFIHWADGRIEPLHERVDDARLQG